MRITLVCDGSLSKIFMREKDLSHIRYDEANVDTSSLVDSFG